MFLEYYLMQDQGFPVPQADGASTTSLNNVASLDKRVHMALLHEAGPGIHIVSSAT